MLRDVLIRLPYRRIRWTIEAVRMLFPRDWPKHTQSYLTVGGTPEQWEQWLRDAHFEGTALSYRYTGEVINLRRPEGTDEEGRPMELHLRARWVGGDDPQALEWIGHVEACRYERQRDHIHENGFRKLLSDELRTILYDVRPGGNGRDE